MNDEHGDSWVEDVAICIFIVVLFTPSPNTITFHADTVTKEVMCIERDRIWVDPEVEVTEAAQKVLEAIGWALNMRDRMVWNGAVEAAAKVCDSYNYGQAPKLIQQTIKELKK